MLDCGNRQVCLKERLVGVILISGFGLYTCDSMF
jgi:hypothetical protein